MQTRRLGKSGIEVSEIGLGCWQLGGDFGPVDDATARAILGAAEQADICFWDTADVYGAGLSETRIADYLGTHHPGIRVATKVGRDPALYPDGYTRAKLRRCVEASLKRLRVDVLDLVQLHCIPPDVLRAGEVFGWLEALQDDGLIRAFGASVETIEEGLVAAAQPRLASLQIIFNLFRQDASDRLFPLAIANDIGIIVRLPLASGVLAGKMKKGQTFARTDHRNYNRHGEVFSQGETFSGIPFDTAVDFADGLRDLVPDGMSQAQMAMRWILDHPAVSTVIAGASRPEQVTANAAVSDVPPLSAGLHETLRRYYRDIVRPAIVVPV